MYEALVARTHELKENITNFMDSSMAKLQNYYRKTDEQLMKVQEEMMEFRNLNMQTKFDIDKLTSAKNLHQESLDRNTKEIARLSRDSVTLFETKTDLKRYELEYKQMDDQL